MILLCLTLTNFLIPGRCTRISTRFDTFTTAQNTERTTYLKASGDVQSHFLDICGRERLEAVLFPLLDQVVEGLLSSVLHGQTLGPVLGSGEGPET